MEALDAKFAALISPCREIEIKIQSLYDRIDELKDELEKEKEKIEEERDKICNEMRQLRFLNYLKENTDSKPIVFLNDECTEYNDDDFWNFHSKDLSSLYKIETCTLKLIYKTDYYANRWSEREFDPEPYRNEYYKGQTEIDIDSFNIDYDQIFEYYQDGNYETDGDSDGIYDLLKLSLTCRMFTKI